jgi:hypothetical protein
MSGGRERIDPRVVEAVEEAAFHRIRALSDKQLMAVFPELSRSSIFRIMRAARKRFHVEQITLLKQMSQSEK